ncbi:Ig-like domain-containing protein, partial [Anaerovorax odorimutans]|uniref:Ig-like domain-containing protein n=1 Tax=Anaerovorax odorimutans TaxID=109327 RepID=UPI0004810595
MEKDCTRSKLRQSKFLSRKKVLVVLIIASLFLQAQVNISSAIEFGTNQTDIEVGNTYNSSTYDTPMIIGDKVLVTWDATTDDWATYSNFCNLVDADGTLSSIPQPTIFPRTDDSSDTIVYKGLSNGNILVYWYSSSSSKGFTDTYFKIINQNGTEIVPATKINSEVGSLNRYTQFAELSNGYLAFVWTTSGTDYALRRFSISGSTVNAEDSSQISLTNLAGMSGSQYNYRIAANNDGQFMVVMSQYDYYYRGMIFNDASPTPNQVSGQNAFVISDRGETDNFITVKLLSNGKFLTVYRKIPTSDTSNRSIAFRIYNADGTPDGEETIVRQIHSWGYIDEPIIVDGGFLLSYYYNDGTAIPYFEYYGNDGTFINDYTSILPTVEGNYGIALPFTDYDGNISFLINDSSDNSNYDIRLLRNESSTEITGFDEIADVSAGYAGNATYTTSTSAIAILPTEVKANNNTVTVPVTTWADTDSYNPNVAGSYTFTATLGSLPTGYENTGNYTATVEVVVTAKTEISGFD